MQEVSPGQTRERELDLSWQTGKVGPVSTRLTFANPTCKVGFGTIAAALAALSLAVLGHFFI